MGDLATLGEIDADAGALFEQAGLFLDLPETHEFPMAERRRWKECLAARTTLIAVDDISGPIGFAAVGRKDGDAYLAQLSVRHRCMAWCTVVIEIGAGAAVFFGAFVSLMSVPMVIVLLVAIVKVHWQFGFSSIKFLAATADGLQFGKPGVECDLLYLAAIAALYLAGPDPWSFDHWNRKSTG